MEKNNYSLVKLYPVLKQLLADGFHLDIHLLKPPYEDLDVIDKGFRRAVFKDYRTGTAVLSDWGLRLAPHNFILIQSTLKFYNIAIICTEEDAPCFLSVGPFRSEEINHFFLQDILQDNRLPDSQIAFLRRFYQSLPLLDPDGISNTLLHFLQAFLPEYGSVEIQKINYSEPGKKIPMERIRIDQYSSDYIKTFDDYLKETVNAVRTGNIPEAMQAVSQFLNHFGISQVTDISRLKKLAGMLNTLLYSATTDAFVHPNYAMKQMTSFDSAIESARNCRVLQRLPYDLVHKYTILIKNYSHPHYSRMVREIIQYIELHLEEDLSLPVLAARFHKSASYLSSTFKAETGTGLANYISSERIHAAMRLLNTTELSVADVAASVGFQDFGYFTKVFKKQIGQTPTDYKKMLGQHPAYPSVSRPGSVS